MNDHITQDTVVLTQEGLEELQAELEELKTVKLPQVVERVVAARTHGDLKENAEYHSAKEEQQLTETRISQIEDVLQRVKVVKHTTSHSQVGIGSQVTVFKKGQKSSKRTFHIVGEYEANPQEGKVSSASPLGKALFGKKKGETAVVKAPSGQVEWVLDSIK